MKKKVIQARISEKLLERFDAALEWEGLSRSDFILHSIREYIDKIEKKKGELKMTFTKEDAQKKEMNIMTKVIEIIEEKTDFPNADESYTVGKVDDGRYFFAWGPDFPKNDEVPGYEIEDGDSGISYHGTADEALTAMQDAVDAVELTME